MSKKVVLSKEQVQEIIDNIGGPDKLAELLGNGTNTVNTWYWGQRKPTSVMATLLLVLHKNNKCVKEVAAVTQFNNSPMLSEEFKEYQALLGLNLNKLAKLLNCNVSTLSLYGSNVKRGIPTSIAKIMHLLVTSEVFRAAWLKEVEYKDLKDI